MYTSIGVIRLTSSFISALFGKFIKIDVDCSSIIIIITNNLVSRSNRPFTPHFHDHHHHHHHHYNHHHGPGNTSQQAGDLDHVHRHPPQLLLDVDAAQALCVPKIFFLLTRASLCCVQ